MTSLDHKRIGVMYIAAAGVFTAIAVVLTVLMATQQLRPDLSIVTGNAYRGTVTVHGVLLVSFVLTPLVLGLAVAVTPLQLGARGISHPGAVAVAFWLLVSGGLAFVLSALGTGGTARSGWTAYPPLSLVSEQTGEDLLLIALLLTAVAVAVTAACLLRTIMRGRAEGLTADRLPAFTISVGVYAGAALVAAVISAVGLILLLVARGSSGTADFLTSGDSQLLGDGTFWLFGNPGAYLLLIPAVGIAVEVVRTFAGEVSLGAGALRALLALLAVTLGLVWLHHTLSVSQGERPATVLLVLAVLSAGPVALLVASLLKGAAGGRGRPQPPLPWALAATVLLLLGGLSGIFFAIWGSDRDLRGTAFTTGHSHLILFGPVLFALVAGLVYWWPKLTGRLLDERLTLAAFGLSFPSFFLLCLMQFFAGDAGQPRGSATYDDGAGLATYNLIESLASYGVTIGLLVLLAAAVRSVLSGRRAGNDPWRADTLEWFTTSPPPAHNFDSLPRITSARPLREIRERLEGRGGR
ncbi:MAG: cbb3-type cytochrome c oxidase subunit I [Gaiella sp.]